jgi:cysteine desulfurase
MLELTLRKVPFSDDSDNRLRTLKARTGLDRNYLCRLGFCLSLEEPGVPAPLPEKVKSARDIDRYTLLGQHGPAYLALLLVWMKANDIPLDSGADVNTFFVAHMNRGVEIITTRLRSLADIASLLPKPSRSANHTNRGNLKDMSEQIKLPIYLDHHATTPMDPRVLEAMTPYFAEIFGNAASKNHAFGREAHRAVESARDTLGKAINARPQDICFTSGATEAVNLAIKGFFQTNRAGPQHFITVITEHPAVLDSFRSIESEGAEVTYLPVDSQGMIDPKQITDAIRPATKLVSVMAANNEIGVIQPLKEIGATCREHNVFLMTDATQALGKIPLDVEAMNIHLLACSAHKIYGPKGIGALYCRRSLPKVSLAPIIHGGGHERGLRSGTLNVPGIIGFAKAAELCLKELKTEQPRLRNLRDRFFHELKRTISEIRLNGHPEHRLASNLNVCIPGVVSESLIIALAEDVALSTGSACTTAKVEPSHVLKALGMSDQDVHSSIRIGIGRTTTEEDVHYAVTRLSKEVNRLEALTST